MDDVAGLSSDKVWVAGRSTSVFRWNGNSWIHLSGAEDQTIYDKKNFNLVSVYPQPTGEVWFGGWEYVLKWDGESWSGSKRFRFDLFTSFHFSSEGDNWAAGGIYPQSQKNKGFIASYEDGSWVKKGETKKPLMDVDGVSSQVWAVGEGGQLFHWTGEGGGGLGLSTLMWLIVGFMVLIIIVLVYLGFRYVFISFLSPAKLGGKLITEKAKHVPY